MTVKRSAVLAACVLRATTKERSTFLGEKVHPRESPGYAPDSG